jgi:DNA-binding MarR family transcriptional regulator
MTTTRWLTPQEMHAWRAFAEVNGALLAALESDLAPHGLSLGDYEVLVLLSETRDHQMRMCDLSQHLGLSPSGLTRRLDGLVKAGYVERLPSTADRRVMLATVTPAGLDALAGAAPDHVASVRLHLIDRLTPEQIEVLGAIFDNVGLGLGRTPATP